MRDARVGREELVVLGWAYEDDPGIREALLGGIHQHAGHGDIRTQRDT